MGTPSIDVPKMIARKNGIVDQLTGGIKGLFKKNKVTLLNGHGSFSGGSEGAWQVKVGDETIPAGVVRGTEDTRWFIEREAASGLAWYHCSL